MPDEPLHRVEKAMRVLMLSALRGLVQRDQIDLLDRAGFGQTDIAELIGTSSKAVSVRLAEIRKARKSAKGKQRG
jgi:predicted transcriptional regulator